jgi:predicted DNA-binding protein (MmcQ/YjbR family)
MGLAPSFVPNQEEQGLDRSARPTLGEVLGVRDRQASRIEAWLAEITLERLAQTAPAPEGAGRPRDDNPRQKGYPIMTSDQVLDLCISLPGAVEDNPFGEGVAVFKVGGLMFALVPLEGTPESVNLKCEPELALELRDRYPSVHPGYHQNKRHWNRVELDGADEDRRPTRGVRDVDHRLSFTAPRPRGFEARTPLVSFIAPRRVEPRALWSARFQNGANCSARHPPA